MRRILAVCALTVSSIAATPSGYAAADTVALDPADGAVSPVPSVIGSGPCLQPVYCGVGSTRWDDEALNDEQAYWRWTVMPQVFVSEGRDVLETFLRISWCESRWHAATSISRTGDWGGFQINWASHRRDLEAGGFTRWDLLEYWVNARYALAVWWRDGTAPWAASRRCWGG